MVVHGFWCPAGEALTPPTGFRSAEVEKSAREQLWSSVLVVFFRWGFGIGNINNWIKEHVVFLIFQSLH
jgi:hypothetical protein